VPHGQSRIDHEVEMARSDLFSAAKNAQQVYSMIKDVGEDEGLDGWVQEKIIKANDYLNTIREYLEGKQVQGVAEGVADMHSNELLNTVRGAIRKAIKETGDQSLSKIFVCLRNARPASEALKNITSPNSLAEVDNALQEVGIDFDDLLDFINKQAEKYGGQGMNEGPEFGSNYAEKLAQYVYNVRPALNSEDDILNIGYKVAVQDLASQTRAVSLFSRDQDFPSDFVSAYRFLQKRRGVTENNQRGDSLVTDSLKIMKGGEVSDAIRALTTVLGNREYNSRRGFYNFYIKQMIDMYRQQGVNEGKRNLKCVCKTHGTMQCPVHTPKDIEVIENNKNKKA